MNKNSLMPMVGDRLSRLLLMALVATLVLVVGPLSLSASHLPQSCQDIKSANPSAADGDYTIYPNNNTQVFTVYCHDMAGTPEEYLTLVHTGGPAGFPFGPIWTLPVDFFQNSFNYSTLEANGPLACEVTTWQKVRLNPATLEVQTDDFTFSQSASLCNSGFNFTVPYAQAGGCQGGFVTAYANVNLAGTPFKVQEAFTLAGTGSRRGFANPPDPPFHPGFGPDYSPNVDGQIVDLGGGGGCGGISPVDWQFLQLAYIGPAFVHPQPFDAFTAKVEIELGAATDDAFEVKGTFTLGAGSNGIDPLTEAVTLELTGGTGSFSTTIPAGSFTFKPAQPGKKGKPGKAAEFKFEGVGGGVSLEVKLTDLGANTFEFKAEGEGTDLTGLANPVTVQLTIGNDSGSVSVTAEFEDDDDDD